MAFDYNKGFEYFDLNMSAISIAGHGKHIALAANREDEITMSGYVILEFNPLINLYNFSPVHNYGTSSPPASLLLRIECGLFQGIATEKPSSTPSMAGVMSKDKLFPLTTQ